MAYTVTWKKQPGHAVIRTEQYDDLDTAMSEADVVIVQPYPIAITVTDEDGQELYFKLAGPLTDD